MSEYDFDSVKAAFDSNDHEFVRKANEWNDALLKELDNVKAKSVEELLVCARRFQRHWMSSCSKFWFGNLYPIFCQEAGQQVPDA